MWVGGYLAKFLPGAGVEGKEGLFSLAVEHQAVVIIVCVVTGELDVGDEEVVILILSRVQLTCSSLVLNHSLALPSLTGITQIINTTIKYKIHPHHPINNYSTALLANLTKVQEPLITQMNSKCYLVLFTSKRESKDELEFSLSVDL